LSKEFIVVGGGIGGLATGLAIAQVGHKVTILEQAPEIGEVGAGIQLAPNATNILKQLGVFDDIAKTAVFPKRLVLKDARTGEELSALDLGEKFRERYGAPYIVLHRADLQYGLLRACEASPNVTIKVDSHVEKVEDLGDAARVTLSNGVTYTADAVIGADGLHSKTRKFFIEDSPVPSEYVAYRGTIPMEEIVERAQIQMDDVIMWIAPYLPLVQYPVRRGELYNLVIVFKSYNYKPDSDDWGTPEEMDRRFADSCEPVKHMVSFISRQRRWPMYDRNPMENWTSKRVALLGDAAHPMLQYMAQGGCQALEDVACLKHCLQTYGDDLSKAFEAYKEERVPRATSVQRNVRLWGEFLHAEDPMAIFLRRRILTRRSADDYSDVDWLYSKKYSI